ncbi:MAG: response regulator transcription factor [Thermoleophilia bacterium]|nr:response regulator transcription factor [Thermoleophilia bacterium]
MRVLLIEDAPRIASFVVKGLGAAGYTVDHVVTGAEGFARAQDPTVDLVILDLGLPDLDGTEVLERLRARGVRVPVLILTARGEVADRVEGLELGADDYLTKPFAFDELLARVRARLRGREAQVGWTLRAGGVELDLRTRNVTGPDGPVELTAREFALLETFMRHAGQVLSREQLLARVWDINWDPGSNVVDVYVGYLRRKLGGRLFETVRGAGYRFPGGGDARIDAGSPVPPEGGPAAS